MPEINPFNYNMPVRPDSFIGRQSLIERIASDLSHPLGDSWAVVGGRRFGKTSLLDALESRLKQLSHYGTGGQYIFPIRVNLAASETVSEEYVYGHILRSVIATLRKERSESKDGAYIAFDAIRPDLTRKASFREFQDALELVNNTFTDENATLRLVLLFDEVESISGLPWSESFFAQLRVLLSSPVSRSAVKAVFAGSTYFIQSRDSRGSPLRNILRVEYLEPFSDSEMEQLLARATGISVEVAESVKVLSGGHPYIAQYLLHYLIEGSSEISSTRVEHAAQQMLQERGADFEGWWKAIGESGRRAYALLAYAGDWLDRRALLAQVSSELTSTQSIDFGKSILSPSLVTSPLNSTLNTHAKSILIITVTKVEAQAVLDSFSQAAGRKWTRQAIGKKTYYNLDIHGGAPIFMVQSEMGTATIGGALLTAHQAIQDLHPQAIIMCGIAFGLRPDKQQLGDILVAKQLQYYEPQKMDLKRGLTPRGDRVTVSERLLDRFRSGDNDWRGAPTHFGVILSGERLVTDPDLRVWLLENEPEAIGGEMEGAGVYAVARDAKVDWILVKAICDWADGKKHDDARQLAALNAAQFVLHVLQLGGWGGPEHFREITESQVSGLFAICCHGLAISNDREQYRVAGDLFKRWFFGNKAEADEYNPPAIRNLFTADFGTADLIAQFGTRVYDLPEDLRFLGADVAQVWPRLLAISQDVRTASESDSSYNRRLGLEHAIDDLRLLDRQLPLLGKRAETRWLLITSRWIHSLQFELRQLSDVPSITVVNPYNAGNPISIRRASLFRGRNDLISVVDTALRQRNRTTIVLHGPRRMGKTSLLLQLPRLLPGGTVPVFVDLQAPDKTSSTVRFLYGIARAIATDARNHSRLTIAMPELNNFEQGPFGAFADYMDDVVLPALEGAGNFTALICFDEFEKLAQALRTGHVDERVLDEMRHTIQHRESISLLFAGVQTLEELGPHWSSYFINVLPIRITYLQNEEAAGLVRNPDPDSGFSLEYTDEAVEDILAITRCHPYLVQLVCSAVVNQANERHTQVATLQLVRDAETAALTMGQPYFRNLWDETTGTDTETINIGRAILRRIAAAPEPVIVLPDSPAFAHALERLVQYDLIEHVGDGVQFQVPFVQRWVRERAPALD